MRWSALILLGLSAACTRLPDRVVRLHRAPALAPIGPTVIAHSDKRRPDWTMSCEEALTFVGQSSGPSREAAQEQALKDLREGVARFLSVEVETDQETHAISDDKSEHFEARIDHRAYASSRAEGIEADGEYWEQLSDGTFRVYMRARLSASDLSKVRLLGQAARARAAGREMIVFLVRGKDPVSSELIEELAARLDAETRFAVADRSMIATLTSSSADSFDDALEIGDRVIEVRATPDGDRYALVLKLQKRGGAAARRVEKIVSSLHLEDSAADLLLDALKEAP